MVNIVHPEDSDPSDRYRTITVAFLPNQSFSKEEYKDTSICRTGCQCSSSERVKIK